MATMVLAKSTEEAVLVVQALPASVAPSSCHVLYFSSVLSILGPGLIIGKIWGESARLTVLPWRLNHGYSWGPIVHLG